MSDGKAPLRLTYEPGEYLCTWTVPDGKGGTTEVPGGVEVSASRPPNGTIYGSVPLTVEHGDNELSASFPQTQSAPALRAVLANGGTLLMLDAEIRVWTPGSGHVSGSAALMGRGDAFTWWSTAKEAPAEDAPVFATARVQIESLDAVAGFAPIAKMKTPFTGPDNPKTEWAYTLQDDLSVEWSGDGCSMSIEYVGSMMARGGYEFGGTFSPVATLTFDKPLSLRQIVDEHVSPLRRVVSVAVGKPRDLTFLAVTPDGSQRELQVFGTGITQAPFASSTDVVRKSRATILAKADELSLLDFMEAWRKLGAEHHPIIETYGSMLQAADEHPRSRYLLLVQALEGLHGFETAAEFETRKNKHAAQREDLIRRVSIVLGPKPRRFISKHLMRSPHRGLDGALKAVITSLPINVMNQLDSSSLVKDAKAEMQNGATTPQALSAVRNALAHGTKGYDPSVLHEVVTVIERVVRAHTLRVLGCPDFVLERVLSD